MTSFQRTFPPVVMETIILQTLVGFNTYNLPLSSKDVQTHVKRARIAKQTPFQNVSSHKVANIYVSMATGLSSRCCEDQSKLP